MQVILYTVWMSPNGFIHLCRRPYSGNLQSLTFVDLKDAVVLLMYRTVLVVQGSRTAIDCHVLWETDIFKRVGTSVQYHFYT